MKNKVLIGTVITALISVAILIWYFSGTGVGIVSIIVPSEVGTQDSGYATIILQNNASRDINVTVNVRNALEDEKGVSLSTPILIVDTSSQPGTFIELPKEFSLKPGVNLINIYYGYKVPGLKKFEVEVYQKGKLADTKSAEITVLPPQIRVELQYTNGTLSGYDIYKVFGSLSNFGRGTAAGVAVNISIIDEITQKVVSSSTRTYRIRDYTFFQPMNTWRGKDGLEKQEAIALIELSRSTPSNESYVPAATVAKGKIGNRYRIMAVAQWQDQTSKAEVIIPPQ
jgi:hypothetical protein